MNLTDDEILKFQKGSPVFLEDICALYTPFMKEVVDLGLTQFHQYLGVLLAEKPIPKVNDDAEYKQLIESLTDFQYLLMWVSMDYEINSTFKNAMRFFTHSEVTISLNPPSIIVGPIEERHILTEEKYYDFQRILRRMCFIEQDGDEIIINPDDPPATKRLKLQMRANREKVRKAKAKKAAQEKSDMKFSDLIGSITINDCGLNMENIWNITYYAFHDQLKRMGWRDQFNINQQAALAGAKINKSQLKHWMRSIASSDK